MSDFYYVELWPIDTTVLKSIDYKWGHAENVIGFLDHFVDHITEDPSII